MRHRIMKWKWTGKKNEKESQNKEEKFELSKKEWISQKIQNETL